MIENIYQSEYVKELFNRMPGSYERINYIASFGFSVRWRTQFLRQFHPTKSKIELINLLTGMSVNYISYFYGCAIGFNGKNNVKEYPQISCE